MTAVIDGHAIAKQWSPVPVPPTPLSRMRGVILAGNILTFGFVAAFGIWSFFAPLESAAIALGTVEAESNRKTIQHLEGGIIREIPVQDGDLVSSGQILVRLDQTRVQAELQSWFQQYWDGKAREARLLAERDGREKIAIPASLIAARSNNPAIETIIAGQQKIFKTRLQVFRSQAAVIHEHMSRVEHEIAGLQAQDDAAGKRAGIIAEERAAVASLVEKGLERRPRLLSLDRERVEIDGRRGEAVAQIARARQVISESKATLFKLESDRQNEIAQSLRDTQNQVATLIERILAMNDQLARMEIRVPKNGIVTNLQIHTPGGIVAPGAPLLDLVPKEDQLIVVARVKPEDIDVVRIGLSAAVRLLPYSARGTPLLTGSVTYVSADRLTDKRTDQPCYSAKIRIDNPQLAPAQGVEMVPGMPAEAFIKTGRSTVALYALKPLLDSFNRAFRED
ncbi:HlyD family type I secretion periplasmic adaptor subunit [Microvirga puerhi]|uniref:Membrane fusion protein (MFP) family protein n=1 Tax=Microvirga puerhi TaxID=2876078 RepID=A0ABS7VSP9_9HYPH|nr:HlyD family type I secretion periplasmic adaptor subunit [Microvirga puerhi]MBZ6078105.1 HlyD family type I secretion periplasmic adaptor subunit [Microvirga puerhi]